MRTIVVNGVELVVDVIGDRGAPVVLLLAGTSSSMDFWRPELCEQLAATGLRVIRFDQRDTGQATHDPAGSPTYSLSDLVDDAVGLLDALGIASAHWVGISQGGWICQLAGIHHPTRVDSMTLLSTRPVGHGENDSDLPEVSQTIIDAFTADEGPRSQDPSAWVDYLVEWERKFSSTAAPFDADAARAAAQDTVSRTHDLAAASTNHQIAPQGRPWRARLNEIDVPVTVLHGSDDLLFPPDNGRALAKEIPGATFELLPETGHELPTRNWQQLITHIAHAHGPRDSPAR
jgi:pimeloyl-ACP methyl ester carboxylesterase